MKKQIFILIFFVSAFCSYSQDTIKFKNNEVKQVKVSEVGINDVKYHRFDNLDGPQYIANKNDISFIKYQNGQKDTFAVAAPVFVSPPSSSPSSSSSSFSSVAPRTLSMRGSKWVYAGRGLGDTKMLRLINDYQYPNTKTILLNDFKTYKQHKRNQYISGFVGLGVGIVAPVFGLLTSLSTLDFYTGDVDWTSFYAGLTVGATVGITGAVISSICHHKRNIKKKEIAKLYNEMK